jgi:ketosteroid isomerase-like protein
MRTRWLLATVVLLVSFPAGVRGQQTGGPEREAVEHVVTSLGEFFQAGDMREAEALFPERGHILTDDATTHGWAEYRDEYLLPELASVEGLRYAHTRVEPVVRGNVAWVAFRREISGAGTAPFEGRGTAVLEKTDDGWVIVHLHLSR